MQLIAKTLLGLEEQVARELKQLGATRLSVEKRAIMFEGELETLYKANLHCRSALRILMPIATFDIESTDDLYEKTKEIDWNQYIGAKQTFAINATVYSESFTHSQFVTYRVKDAICDQLREKNGDRPTISVHDPDILINIHLSHHTVTLSLDSSGESLQHRGYKVMQTEAPISEALAAGMLEKAGWDGQCDFVDPMCGSGTFLIEAAMIALNIPPGIYRKKFAFERWQNFDKDLFDELYNDDSCEREFNFHIYGFDKNKSAVLVAQENIKAAGLDKYITVEVREIKDFERPTENPCLLATNPPYGERLLSNNREEVEQVYAELGTALKHNLKGCKAWVISSDTDCLKRIGLKPDSKHKLLNGELPCEFWELGIFDGRRNDHLAKQAAEGTLVKKEPREAAKSTSRRYDKEVKKVGRFDKRDDKRGFKPRRDEEHNDRPFGDRRRSFGDKEKRDFKPRREGDRFSKPFGDKKRSFGDGEKRDFKPRRDGEKRSFGPKKSFGANGTKRFDRKPNRD